MLYKLMLLILLIPLMPIVAKWVQL